jgi:uncharacterized protein
MFQSIRVVGSFVPGIVSGHGMLMAFLFLFRSFQDLRNVERWLKFISGHFACIGVAAPDLSVLRKPLRSYSRIGLSLADQVSLLEGHYQLAHSLLSNEIHSALCGGRSVSLARLVGAKQDFFLNLKAAYSGQKHEGEITIAMIGTEDGMLSKLAFLFARDAHGLMMIVGGLQGPPAGRDKRIIVRATRQLSGLRPKEAVLVAAQAIATVVGAQRIFAVSNATHVINADWGAKLHSDYDAFWHERGGRAYQPIGFQLPIEIYANRVLEGRPARKIDHHRASIEAQVLEAMIPTQEKTGGRRANVTPLDPMF